MQELENRKLARVAEEAFEGELPHEVVLWTDARGSVLDGWDTFWDELRAHMSGRSDATLDDVIVDLDFSLLDLCQPAEERAMQACVAASMGTTRPRICLDPTQSHCLLAPRASSRVLATSLFEDLAAGLHGGRFGKTT